MQVRLFTYPSIILILILFLDCKISFAQDVPLILIKENLIFTTLNNMEKMQDLNRERAIRETMQEAQMRLMESKLIPKIVKERERGEGFRFKDLASHAHPYLNVETLFDDNVDTGSELRKSSIAHTFTPGLKINFLGSSRGKSIILNTYIQNLYYNNRSRSNAQSAELDLLGTFNIGRYTLYVSNNYFTNYIAKSELVAHDKSDYYWNDAFKVGLGRYFNRIGFDIGYGVGDYGHQSTADSLTNRIVQTFNFRQFLRIATRTRLTFEYNHDRTEYTYTSSSDSNIYNYSLGLSGILSSKLTGLMKMAYSLGDYKTGDDSKTTFTGELGYNLSERTNYSLGFSRIIYEPTTDSGYYIENDLSLRCNHRLGFNPKFWLSFDGGVSLSDYPKNITSNEVDTYTFSSGLSYAFRQWLDFSLNYGYIKKASKGASYYSNSILFKTQMRF